MVRKEKKGGKFNVYGGKGEFLPDEGGRTLGVHKSLEEFCSSSKEGEPTYTLYESLPGVPVQSALVE